MVNVGKYTIHGLFGYDTVIMSAKHYVLRCMKVRVETYLSFAQEYHFELKSMFIKQHFWFELILDMEDILCFILHSSTTLIDFCSRITVFFWEPVWNPGWTDHNDWINADFLCVCVCVQGDRFRPFMVDTGLLRKDEVRREVFCFWLRFPYSANG